MEEINIYWFRRDLRIEDNPALLAACEEKKPLLLIYTYDPQAEDMPAGAASRCWLHHALEDLEKSLQQKGHKLHIFRGPAQDVLADLATPYKVDSLYLNQIWEPALYQADLAIARQCDQLGIQLHSFNDNYLLSPDKLLNKKELPYQVFTPFYRRCLEVVHPRDLSDTLSNWAPSPQLAPNTPRPVSLSSLHLLDEHPWHETLMTHWSPTESAANKRLESFTQNALAQYEQGRDRMDRDGVSRLSPYLHFGQISPVSILKTLENQKGSEPFVRQLYWREFANYILWHYPHSIQKSLRQDFQSFPWEMNQHFFRAWKQGQTGFDLIDAAMQELWQTGWMHNRCRMLVASFLVKNLNIPWQAGAAWFHDTLVDADLANNIMGWQWCSGCGVDAAPYFRIFNPITQADKFDLDKRYRQRFQPKQRPSEAIIDYKASRENALNRYQKWKNP